jgi:hypothetical protein
MNEWMNLIQTKTKNNGILWTVLDCKFGFYDLLHFLQPCLLIFNSKEYTLIHMYVSSTEYSTLPRNAT